MRASDARSRGQEWDCCLRRLLELTIILSQGSRASGATIKVPRSAVTRGRESPVPKLKGDDSQARSRPRKFRCASGEFLASSSAGYNPANPMAAFRFGRWGTRPRNRSGAKLLDGEKCAMVCNPARPSRPRAAGQALALVVPESSLLDARKSSVVALVFRPARGGRDLFEDEIAIPVMAELPKNLGNRETCFAQFAQDLGLVPDERIAVSPVPVCFAMPPSFFDDHPTHGQNGKVDCLVDASFPALSFRFENQKFAPDQAAPFRISRARFLKRIFQPGRNGPSGRASIPIALSAGSVDESGRAVGRATERAISVVDEASWRYRASNGIRGPGSPRVAR